ncbi:MAG: hypothetical protein IJ946_01630 [Clostridia bacterium]|nr:hypothetical protein [Clostridia bacterium]
MFGKCFKKIVSALIVFALVFAIIPLNAFSVSTADSLNGKSIIFFGDSIGAGWRDNASVSDYSNSGGWHKRIVDNYGATATLAANAGAPLSTIRESEGRPSVIQQLHDNRNGKYDYVVLQGGFNDAMGTNSNPTKETAAKIGNLTESFNLNDYDESTFAGALETLFYYTNEYFPEAKVGFIITYATPLSTYGGYTAEEDSMREYWNMAKAVCDKWEVSYLDLFDGKTKDGKSYSYDILKVDTTENFPGGNDCIHLNAAGYDVITPYIAEWLPTTNTIDKIERIEFKDIFLDFEEDYAYSNGEVYYSDTKAENLTSANSRGSHAEIITETDGNTAVRLTYDNGNNNENYAANPAINIYDPQSSLKFIGEAGKKYVIEFSYKVENSCGKSLSLFVAACNRSFGIPYANQTAFQSTNLQLDHSTAMNTSNIQVVAAATDISEKTSFTAAKAIFTANGIDYPIIALVTNSRTTDSGADEYASVLIDDVFVYEYVAPERVTSYTLDFEEKYVESGGSEYYGEGSSLNWTNDTGRSSKVELIKEADGNNALRMTYKLGRDVNYKDNPALSIYDPDSLSRFAGVDGKSYLISFDVKIENTDSTHLKLYLVNCGRYTQGLGLNGTDCNLNNSSMKATDFVYKQMGDTFYDVTSGYTRVSARFTGNGSDTPLIILSANDSITVSGHSNKDFASVLIDNISVEEDVQQSVTFYNYDGADKEINVFKSTVFEELSKPYRKGYYFGGFYTDKAFTREAKENELVSNYDAVYVKWLGDGTSITATDITEYFTPYDLKSAPSTIPTINKTTFSLDYSVSQPAAETHRENAIASYKGACVLSSEKVVTGSTEKISIDNMRLNVNCENDEVMFYVEVPDFQKAGASWGMAFCDNGMVLYQDNKWCWSKLAAENNVFYYLENSKWKKGTIEKDSGIFSIPSGYKGIIKFDCSELTYLQEVDFDKQYVFNCANLKFNAVGGECGNAAVGNVFYSVTENSDSLIMKYLNKYYSIDLVSKEMVVLPYDAYSENYDISIRYNGTSGKVNLKPQIAETSAHWAKNPVGFASLNGETVSDMGYMNTYNLKDLNVALQPLVDSFMFYVEIPSFSKETCSLKLLNVVLKQGINTETALFSNSNYKFMDVNYGVWQNARAGADGELFDLKSGFKGYVKFDIKYFKNVDGIKLIDFSKIYSISSLSIGVNNFNGEKEDFVIGAFYSILKDGDVNVLKNAATLESTSVTVLPGDLDLDTNLTTTDLANLKLALAGVKTINKQEKLRADAVSDYKEYNTTGLANLKLILAGVKEVELPMIEEKEFKEIFSPDVITDKEPIVYGNVAVTDYQKIIEADTSLNSNQNAVDFAADISKNKVSDFEKTGIDKMCHVSTFIYSGGKIYMSYYANTMSGAENPAYQVARMAYCDENTPDNKVILDIQSVGDDLYGKRVVGVYDTIIMQKPDEPQNIYILWTANIEGKYYRLYRIFNTETETLGEIGVNRFKVNDTVNDFSTTGIKNALTVNGIGYKAMFSDIGIMQKLSSRVENGETYYYSGTYSGYFTAIIKSKDLITWEYVSQPNDGFENDTKWENAVYVLNDKVYYFVRQNDPVYKDGVLTEGSPYGILTYYDLITKEWAKPVLVGDCQSRSDFIFYNGELYVFYAPTDRNHIGILKIGTENLAETEVVLQADMKGSCFYPFVQYTSSGELAMSYTVNRSHIRLATFKLSDYL